MAHISRRKFLDLGACSAAVALSSAALGCSHTQPSSSSADRDLVSSMIDSLTLEEKLAQLFIVTPEQAFGIDLVTQTNDSMSADLVEFPVGGLILFGSNLENADQTKALLSGFKQLASTSSVLPLFYCVDEEGGSVQRIGGKEGFNAPWVDHAANIGASEDPEQARQSATGIAEELLALGFNVDFAPSCEVSAGPQSVMHQRSFSTDAELAARMVEAQIEAFNEAGILCCAKHFPGIGDPETDSHDGAITTSKSRAEMEAQLVPFKAAIAASVPFVMVSHLSVPSLTGSNVPASLSSDIVTGLLREELGYDGIVVTDSLSMGAMGAYADPSDVAVMAIKAGCDIALMPPDVSAALAGLRSALDVGHITMSRIDESLQRILTLKLNTLSIQEQ